MEEKEKEEEEEEEKKEEEGEENKETEGEGPAHTLKKEGKKCWNSV